MVTGLYLHLNFAFWNKHPFNILIIPDHTWMWLVLNCQLPCRRSISLPDTFRYGKYSEGITFVMRVLCAYLYVHFIKPIKRSTKFNYFDISKSQDHSTRSKAFFGQAEIQQNHLILPSNLPYTSSFNTPSMTRVGQAGLISFSRLKLCIKFCNMCSIGSPVTNIRGPSFWWSNFMTVKLLEYDNW